MHDHPSQVFNILLDVDGVLADFFGHALAAHEATRLARNWPAGEWDMAKTIGITEAEFWKPLDTYEFWRSVPLYREAKWFHDRLAELGPVTFCTSPSRNPQCVAAKIEWLREHFGDDAAVMIGARKYLMARSDSVLIDDFDKNVDTFRAWGGAAVQMPRPWNRGHVSCENPHEDTFCAVQHIAMLRGIIERPVWEPDNVRVAQQFARSDD